jgi:hypothetical protein
MVREGVGAGGRNDPSLVCTYEKIKIKRERLIGSLDELTLFH